MFFPGFDGYFSSYGSPSGVLFFWETYASIVVLCYTVGPVGHGPGIGLAARVYIVGIIKVIVFICLELT